MKGSEIKVGDFYLAKVSDKVVTVKVDAIRTVMGSKRDEKRYDVTNTVTNRKTTFRSAAKFRSRAVDPNTVARKVIAEVEKRPDPTPLTHPQVGTTVETNGLAAKLTNRPHPVLGSAPHVIVEARAGTGKTTTLVEGLKLVKGIAPTITPSEQQQAVWDQLMLSKGAMSICFVAFNKSIATELQTRVPAGCEAMTMHSLGYKAVMKSLGYQKPNEYVVKDIIADILQKDFRQLMKESFVLVNATEQLVGLCKQNLISPTTEAEWWEALDTLASHYDVDLNGSREKVYDLVPKVLERCKAPKGKIGFDDMIWLPVVLNLPLPRYDLLLVDEAQDLNRCQQELAKRCGKRLVLVGDPKQAIYGFAGADSEAMPRLGRELSNVCQETDTVIQGKAGCVTLPLTVTRRCGKAIVEDAKAIVPDFSAHESNGAGKVSQASYTIRAKQEVPWEKTYGPLVQAGDMVLCRVNAPLVSQCFRFLKRGIKANILGRDVGKGLSSLVNKLKAYSIEDLVGKLTDWQAKEEAKEQAKRNPNDAKLIAIQDKVDCLICFTDGAGSVDEVLRKIDSVFTDDKQSPGVRFSSIHKSKGLESKRVFLLEPEGATVPHPMAKKPWQRDQEYNLRYVAITRAIEELVYVS